MLFKLETRSEATPRAVRQGARRRSRAKIYESRLDGETKKFLERLRTQALIEWKDDVPADVREGARGEGRRATPGQGQG